MRLAWTLERLRNMGPAEVLHRVGEVARKRLSRGRHEGWKRYPAPAALPRLPGIRDAFLTANPAQRDAIRTAAGRTLAGRFTALGVDWPQRHLAKLFPPDLWRLDPVTGTVWPGADTYTSDISYRHDGTRGDVKYVWEINRLQFLVPVAAQVLLAGEAESLVAIEAAIGSWHAANPPYRGLAWASGIEVALRAISLLLALSLCGEKLSPRVQRQAGEILAASRFWLPRFPSLHSSANNHLVAELAGQFLLEAAFDGKPARSRLALLAEIDKQILPDGSGAEQTPTYAAFTVELALLCGLVAKGAGQPFPASFDARLSAFAAGIGWLGGDGNPPAIGDDDEGRVVTLGPEPGYARSIAAASAAFAHWTAPAAPGDDIRALLFGTPPPGPVPEGLHTFPNGGLSVWHGQLERRRVRLTFDHGPLGYLAIAAHGHADALSITLALDGEDVLVDPGTYLYGSGGAWRDWFRGTQAHNTLNLGGASQSLISGPFNWSAKARATLLEASGTAPDWRLSASHDGYLARFGVEHRRTITPAPYGLVLEDRLLGGTAEAEIVFQLAIGLEASIADSIVTVTRQSAPLLRLAFPTAAIAISRGGEQPGGGWVSPRFGEKQPATRLAWRGPVGPDGVTTRIGILPPLDTPQSQT